MPTLYARIGPANIRKLVLAFYPLVSAHPLLAPLFPEDLSETMNKQEAFLTGFLGGPPLYHQTYGHPMLRARHLKFPITRSVALAWFECFTLAAQTLELPPDVFEELLAAVGRTAAAMVNTPG